MHTLRMAVTAKMLAGVIAPAPNTASHTRQSENMSWHFCTRDVLKPPDNETGIQPESSHAPRPAEHGGDEPARILGGRAAHPSPVLLSTRVSSGAEKLLEERERAELTVVDQYQGPDRAEANKPLLGWARPGAGGSTAISSVKINSPFGVLGVNLIGSALHRPAPRGMPDVSTGVSGRAPVQRLKLDEYLTHSRTGSSPTGMEIRPSGTIPRRARNES